MSKKEFISMYVDSTLQNTARVLLDSRDRTLQEWRAYWQRTLNSPSK